MPKSKKRKFIRYFLLLFWISVFGWQFYQMNASDFDESVVFASDEEVKFTESEDYLSFHSIKCLSKTSILFFPGALVQPEAYAPLARKLAKHGYEVYIQKIPFRIALTDNMEQEALKIASEKIKSATDTKWIVAGHSRGGRMAANFASEYPETISGMILLGTSHPKEKNLTGLKFPVLKVSASEDGLASPSEIKQFASNLPSSTKFVMIEGGNHSQFGYYGFQFGSGSATITRKEQQQITETEILDYLNSLN
ncbi:MAG: alpha/beta fold hydrolase [Balneola sp.]